MSSMELLWVRFWRSHRLRLFLSLLMLSGSMLAVLYFAGCRNTDAPLPEESATPSAPNLPVFPSDSTLSAKSTAPDPQAVLDQMVLAYRGAVSYSDNAVIQMIGNVLPMRSPPAPIPCKVAFQKPNKIFLEIADGTFLCDGEDCFAQIRSLPDQILRYPAPDFWMLDTLFNDVYLDDAMRLGIPSSAFRFSPQLVMLLAKNPLNTFCPNGAVVEWVERQPIGQTMCDVIRIRHTDGNRILWISQENRILLRLDYQPLGLPLPEGFDSIEAIRIDMNDAQFNALFSYETIPSDDRVEVLSFCSDQLGLPLQAEHEQRLKLMTDSDTYRQMDPHTESVVSTALPPKIKPTSFSLSPIWTQYLAGVHTMAFMPSSLSAQPRRADDVPKLLIPHESNMLAVMDLQGKIEQKVLPTGLDGLIITNMNVHAGSQRQRMGILTLDGKFYQYDGSVQPLIDDRINLDNVNVHQMNIAQSDSASLRIRHFLFVTQNDGSDKESGSLLLGILQEPAESINTSSRNSLLCALHESSNKDWELPIEGELNQIASAEIEDQFCLLVSYTATQDSILMLSPDGKVIRSFTIPYGKRVVWFHVFGSTIYVLLENTDTGDMQFAGLDTQGKSLWGRLLPYGEYDVLPVYVPSMEKWLVTSQSGEILVFDLIGNLIDRFSLGVIPTSLLCAEVGGECFLIVADGEIVSAWRMEKRK